MSHLVDVFHIFHVLHVLHVTHVLQTYSIFSHPGWQDGTTSAALLPSHFIDATLISSADHIPQTVQSLIAKRISPPYSPKDGGVEGVEVKNTMRVFLWSLYDMDKSSLEVLTFLLSKAPEIEASPTSDPRVPVVGMASNSDTE